MLNPINLKKIRTALKGKKLVGFEKIGATRDESSSQGKVGAPKVGGLKLKRA